MRHPLHLAFVALSYLIGIVTLGVCDGQAAVALPPGVEAMWDLAKAYHETTATRERISINGLWRWQPADAKADQPPAANWGYFKVPAPWPGPPPAWPGPGEYGRGGEQICFMHPSWEGTDLGRVSTAWYQREITIPAGWEGRRIAVSASYVNSWAAVYVDGAKAGEIRFPGGEVEITSVCRPGKKHVLSMRVAAMPLRDVLLSFGDTNQTREVRGSVVRRGLCGDVYLKSTPAAARIGRIRVDTSVRRWQITFNAALRGLAADGRYALRARISDGSRNVAEFVSKAFMASELKEGRTAFTESWKPEKLWDIITPENQYQAELSLVDAKGQVLDTALPVRFGFRELWIDGRDFYLNGTRIFLSALPADNAQMGTYLSTYEGAKESFLRLKGIGINLVYTHNYSCEPGTHLSFEEILRAADDAGILFSLSQPHFGHYEWAATDASRKNGYAGHAAFYVGVAASHPSVVFYSTSHNATGYSDAMNPDLIDGIHDRRVEAWEAGNARTALKAEAIIAGLDPSRIIYHHSSGNLGSMHTVNFYTNMCPIQELDEWFGHWATTGVKPIFTVEYMVPFSWDFGMFRGWYKGVRDYGHIPTAWDLSVAEWSAQLLGDQAYQISEAEKTDVRWEAKQFQKGVPWTVWSYPYPIDKAMSKIEHAHAVIGRYLSSNWRAYRTWGVSANSPWEWEVYFRPREGADGRRKALPVDWETLQRPGYSPDYVNRASERMNFGFERSDWIATADGQAILRNNRPLLAYIGGKPAAFTSKDHNFTPGETVVKQIIVINNSRRSVTADCKWSLNLPEPVSGEKSAVTIATGNQERIAVHLPLPATLAPGKYELKANIRFTSGQTQIETQDDSFMINVLPPPAAAETAAKIAIFDPTGQSARLLAAEGIKCQPVEAEADMAGYGMLVVGKGALTVDGPGPDVSRVREGLKVIVFEQTAEAMEKRLGFRVAEYGLRQVFKRVPDHPALAGLDVENLHDWRGASTIMPPRIKYFPSRVYDGNQAIHWCGFELPQVWRCGNRGNVASVLIEKPARGDFLPILDGGYSLQYGPLMEYREGKGLVLFCQIDVSGRTEQDPAAETLVGNLVRYAAAWKPRASRMALYAGDPAGKRHLEFSGIAVASYDGGKLTPEQVLVVGAGGGRKLAACRADVAEFLRSGGHLLTLGLDESEASALLPFKVGMKKAEHLAAYFEPPAADSLFAGICPADVYNRAPRDLPLVASGAETLGDGVLAKAVSANVVFCQFPPYLVSKAEGAPPSFIVNDDDAADGKRSALLTMGSIGGQGMHLGQEVKGADIRVGKGYTFAALVKPLGEPVTARLEIGRAEDPGNMPGRAQTVSAMDNVAKGQDISLKADQWTELHISFTVDKPYPKGWFAFLSCAQEGARLHADLFRLYEGEYVPASGPQAQTLSAGVRNLLVNPSFESGPAGWQIFYQEQYNLRRTYRRTAFQLARLLGNMGVSAPTPVLARFSSPVTKDRPEMRWLDALYLDQPEDWDYPYRFFGW